ncbi:MAG: DUF4097 family beta strand repeat-containing protein [Lachnospiraceae bacterium]|nr:DUF4097 family beta strand repeat-containing protein [Lachnospiraceae bacterium]
MKRHKRIFAILLTFSLVAVLLSGCEFHASFGIGNFITGESYPNAESYQTGAFTYDADKVNCVEIYWHSGEVEIVESDGDEFSARESGGELPEDTAMHYLLEDGTLRIHFCESDVKIQVNPKDKRLTVEVPKGIDLSVHTTSAPVKADVLEQNSILISAHSGRTELGKVKADSVDLSSSSGSIQANSVSAQTLKCNTSSGSVRIDSLASDIAEVQTSSGGIDLVLDVASQVDIHTSSGKTSLHLPEGGAEVSYTASSGRMHTAEPFERKGDLYVFGKGESKITVSSASGNLEVQ